MFHHTESHHADELASPGVATPNGCDPQAIRPVNISTRTNAPHVKGIPRKVEARLARPATSNARPYGSTSILRAISASTKMIGIRSTHDAGQTNTSIGTPASAHAGIGTESNAKRKKQAVTWNGARRRWETITL